MISNTLYDEFKNDNDYNDLINLVEDMEYIVEILDKCNNRLLDLYVDKIKEWLYETWRYLYS